MRRKISSILAILIAINLFACANTTGINKIGLRGSASDEYAAVSKDMSFVVFPFNDRLDQIEFATNVESVLLQVGLNVLSQPRGTKLIEERKGAGVSQSGGVSQTGATALQQTEKQALRIEKYMAIEDIKADFIIDTMLSRHDGLIKFTKKQDNRVVGVVNVFSGRQMERDLLPYLEKLNFIKKVSK